MEAQNDPQNGPSPQPAEGERRDLIDMMNDLQSKLVASGHSLDVNLPQIAVVGSQSAGKSSVLENIVGREFLPRGNGVVTRRPTLIQLYPTQGEEYGVFGHKPNERFSDFDLIKHEIAAQMPPPNVFSANPIQLKIFSPRVLKLTLVDLPGLVKVALDGHRETNIREVREMVLRHINQPECLILAVTPANQDLANSDALEIARTVDPQKTRTIGVLTKLDLMDAGTDAREILENKQIQLKRGYVGVLNRSQMEIDAGRDIQYILNKEREFFASQSCYSHLSDRLGTPYLQRLLQKTLRAHIKTALPNVRNKLAEKLSGYEKQLRAFQEKAGEGEGARQLFMLKLVNNFIADIEMKLMGHSEMLDMSNLSAGAYINYKLNNEVQNNLRIALVPDKQELTVLITSLRGIRDSISIPSQALDATCRKLLAQYEEPMQRSVQCVQEVLEEAIAESAELLSSYMATKNEVLYKIKRCLEKETARTIEKLNEHVEAEMYFVNLQHPEMTSHEFDPLILDASAGKVWNNTQVEEASEEVQFTTHEPGLKAKTAPLVGILMENTIIQKKVEYLTQIINKYLKIVQKQISDLTIKYICCFLIKKVLNYIKVDLVHSLLNESNFSALTEDCEEDFRKKEEMETTCVILKDALRAIAEF